MAWLLLPEAPPMIDLAHESVSAVLQQALPFVEVRRRLAVGLQLLQDHAPTAVQLASAVLPAKEVMG
jgi:hypothetical protein